MKISQNTKVIFAKFRIAKEAGTLLHVQFIAVFVRNAANLANILPKASRTTFT
jgi:hypothetical protein